MTDEHKKKIGKANSKIMREKWKDPVYHKRMSDAHKGYKYPPSRVSLFKGKPPWNKSLRGYNAGAKSHFWRGGICPKNALIRSSLEYKLWRKSVFERDNYTCIWCGVRSGKGIAVILHADHIKPFAYYPELRFALDNGRTLCKECHSTTDTYLRRTIKKYTSDD